MAASNPFPDRITYSRMLLLSMILLVVVVGGAIAAYGFGITAILLAIVIAFLISWYFTKPIRAIVSDVDTIAKGNLDHTISPTSWQEFKALEESVNSMVMSLKSSIERERELEEKYRNLVEATGDIIWEVNSDLIFTSISARTRQVLGYDPEEIIGKTLLDFMPADEASRIGPVFQKVIREMSPFSFIEAAFSTKDGSVVILEISGVPVPSKGGPALLMRGVARDVTRRKKAEDEIRRLYADMEVRIEERTAELRSAEETARVANVKLNHMGSVARHDILNSLTVVLGFIRIAKQAPNAAARETAIDKIEAAANKIRRQIAFTKEYQNLGVKAPQWQGVSTLISKASPHGSMSAVQIIDETDSLFVFADPLFEKVFSTLIDNAVMHGGEQLTTIRFSWFKKDGDLIISCEDDGKGVPQENKSLIFERGFGTNAGPGLFLCREIILAITGMTIEETGQPGHGARFDIRVPEGKYRFNGSG